MSKQNRDRVTRLRDQIADLQSKAAKEKKAAGKCRTDAQRRLSSISKHTSQSQSSQKRRDASKLEEKASSHDQKAAGFAKQISGKDRQLNSALATLERAENSDARKADRERKKELAELEEIERRRRISRTEPGSALTLHGIGIASGGGTPREQNDGDPKYDVCLSFAGEQRGYVELVNTELQNRGYKVFYDMDEQADLWGKDLAEHFDFIFRKNSRVCVMFVSKEYAEKAWTRHEKRAALARGLEDDGYVLPARFDDTDLPGLSPTIAYIEVSQFAPASLAELLSAKIGPPLGAVDD